MTDKHTELLTLRRAVAALVRRGAKMAVATGAAVAVSAGAAAFPAVFELAALDPANGGDGSSGTVFANAGRALEMGGDVNGDGIDDLVLGDADDNAIVVFGRAEGFPAAVDASAILPANGGDGSDGFATMEHAIPIGDINGDGIDDLIVGGSIEQLPGAASDGDIVYVLYGRATAFDASFDGAALLPQNGGDGSEGFAVLTPSQFFLRDFRVQNVGRSIDLNADGIDDLVLGHPYADNQRGRVYVVYGRASGFDAVTDIADMPPDGDKLAGMVVYGEFDVTGRFDGDLAGASIATGDINGDNVDDLVVGPWNARRSYVVFGSRLGLPDELYTAHLAPLNGGDGTAGGIVSGNDESLGLVGANVFSAGDINGDGLDDLVSGQPYYNGGGTGRFFMAFSDRLADVEINVRELLPTNGGDGSEGYIVQGEPSAFDGHSAAGGADVNGDGLDDLIVPGASDPDGPPLSGSAVVVFGCDSCPAEIRKEHLRYGDGSAGFALDGAEENDRAGGTIAMGGDVNDDGRADMLVGAMRFDSNFVPLGGKTYLVLGRGPDSDGDGLDDDVDNCTELANVQQRDTDGDGHGNACDADFDNDCVVTSPDLGYFKSVFFTADVDADLNGDGVVNSVDLGGIKLQFFGPPGPSAAPSLCSDP